MGQQLSTSFPYHVGEKDYTLSGPGVFAMQKGSRKADNAAVSVFVCSRPAPTPPAHWDLARNALRRMKTARHPDLLPYLDGVELEGAVYIITPQVVPLRVAVSAYGSALNAAAAWGLYQICRGLRFLNEEAKMVHRTVSMDSVYVDASGDWKLAGFEQLGEATDEDRGVDAGGLANLIQEIFQNKQMPAGLAGSVRRLAHEDPLRRCTIKAFVEMNCTVGGFFANDFVETQLFLDEIMLKEPASRENFYKNLTEKLDTFPPAACQKKILPKLIEAIDFAGGGVHVLPALMKIGSTLSDDLFRKVVVPCLVRLIAIPDRAVRMQLLQLLPKFIEHLSAEVVDETVFPSLANGFEDTAPALREATVKASLLIAPKLTERTMSQQLLRHFARLQMDQEPAIRTNTTVCLGKIAVHMSDTLRKKVLISGFQRAFRDPFEHARNAAIMAFVSTKEFYTLDELCQRVIPSISVMMADPVPMVRASSITALRTLIDRCEQMMKDEAAKAANKQADKANSVLGVIGNMTIPSLASSTGTNSTGAAADAAQGSGGAGWGGWAASNFTTLAGSLARKLNQPAPSNPTGNSNVTPQNGALASSAISSISATAGTAASTNVKTAAKAVVDEDEEVDNWQDPAEDWADRDDPVARAFAPAAKDKSSRNGDGWNDDDDDNWDPIEKSDDPNGAPVINWNSVTKTAPLKLAPAVSTLAPAAKPSLSGSSLQLGVKTAPVKKVADGWGDDDWNTPIVKPAVPAVVPTNVASSKLGASKPVASGAMKLGNSAATTTTAAAAAATVATTTISTKSAAPVVASGWDDEDSSWGSVVVKPTAASVKPVVPMQTKLAVPVTASGWGDDDDDWSTAAPKAPAPTATSTSTSGVDNGWGDDAWGDDGGGDKDEQKRKRAEERAKASHERAKVQQEQRQLRQTNKLGSKLGAVKKEEKM